MKQEYQNDMSPWIAMRENSHCLTHNIGVSVADFIKFTEPIILLTLDLILYRPVLRFDFFLCLRLYDTFDIRKI